MLEYLKNDKFRAPCNFLENTMERMLTVINSIDPTKSDGENLHSFNADMMREMVLFLYKYNEKSYKNNIFIEKLIDKIYRKFEYNIVYVNVFTGFDTFKDLNKQKYSSSFMKNFLYKIFLTIWSESYYYHVKRVYLFNEIYMNMHWIKINIDDSDIILPYKCFNDKCECARYNYYKDDPIFRLIKKKLFDDFGKYNFFSNYKHFKFPFSDYKKDLSIKFDCTRY